MGERVTKVSKAGVQQQGNRPKPDKRGKVVLNTTYETPPTRAKPSRARAEEYREAEKSKKEGETKAKEAKAQQGSRLNQAKRRKAVLKTTYETPPSNTKPRQGRAREYREARETTLW